MLVVERTEDKHIRLSLEFFAGNKSRIIVIIVVIVMVLLVVTGWIVVKKRTKQQPRENIESESYYLACEVGDLLKVLFKSRKWIAKKCYVPHEWIR